MVWWYISAAWAGVIEPDIIVISVFISPVTSMLSRHLPLLSPASAPLERFFILNIQAVALKLSILPAAPLLPILSQNSLPVLIACAILWGGNSFGYLATYLSTVSQSHSGKLPLL